MNPSSSTNSDNKWWYLAALIVSISGLLSFFLRPLEPLAWQWADDALYFNNAKSIVENFGHAEWLGPFDELVLAKAPFFPIFLSIAHILSVPLRVAEFLLFCTLPAITTLALMPMRLQPGKVLLISSVCLLLIPILNNELRLTRSTLFGFVLLLYLIALMGSLVSAKSRSLTITLCWSALAGFSFGIASITREEASWLILPAAVASAGYAIRDISKRRLARLAILFLVGLVAHSAPIMWVSVKNESGYGISSPSLRQDSSFRALYTTLSSLEPSTQVKFVPILTSTRLKLYELSPLFRELQPYLEGPALDSLALAKGHHVLNNWTSGNREFFVSNFEFALAKAIYLSGRTRGEEFVHFCEQVTQEIKTAVSAELIDSGGFVVPMLAPISAGNLLPALAGSLKSLEFLLTGQGMRAAKPTHNEVSAGAAEWHGFLRSWPPAVQSGSYSEQREPAIIYSVIKSALQTLTIPIFLLSLVSVFIAARAGQNGVRLIESIPLLLLGVSGVVAFSLAMGLVNEIGFPVLTYPSSYNRMGFFPLHFMLMICGVMMLLAARTFKTNQPSANDHQAVFLSAGRSTNN